MFLREKFHNHDDDSYNICFDFSSRYLQLVWEFQNMGIDFLCSGQQQLSNVKYLRYSQDIYIYKCYVAPFNYISFRFGNLKYLSSQNLARIKSPIADP